jgi:hypothetical protein
LGQAGDAQLLAHERECADCAEWLQNRHALAGALQVLRNSAVGMEAPLGVEQNVMRAFRGNAHAVLTAEPKPLPLPQVFAFRLSRVFEFGAYAAAAAALAVTLGIGVWYLQQHQKAGDTAAQQNTKAEPMQQSARSNVATQASAQLKPAHTIQHVSNTGNVAVRQSSGSVPILVAAQQAEGYTPMMLCDPLSCSGDEQIVRMEIPASEGSQGSQMADVIIGEDGLVRAIRIVQQ